jgi:hypothetical protein
MLPPIIKILNAIRGSHMLADEAEAPHDFTEQPFMVLAVKTKRGKWMHPRLNRPVLRAVLVKL